MPRSHRLPRTFVWSSQREVVSPVNLWTHQLTSTALCFSSEDPHKTVFNKRLTDFKSSLGSPWYNPVPCFVEEDAEDLRLASWPRRDTQRCNRDWKVSDFPGHYSVWPLESQHNSLLAHTCLLRAPTTEFHSSVNFLVLWLYFHLASWIGCLAQFFQQQTDHFSSV